MVRRRVVIIVAQMLLYIGSYLVLSRQGFTQADAWNATGFWFFQPRDSDLWRVSNYGCVGIYYPLIVIDNWLGAGRWPAKEPLWGLSKQRCISPPVRRGRSP
jgi:hypothetical protein